MNCLSKIKMKYSLDHPKKSELDTVRADLKLFNRDYIDKQKYNLEQRKTLSMTLVNF